MRRSTSRPRGTSRCARPSARDPSSTRNAPCRLATQPPNVIDNNKQQIQGNVACCPERNVKIEISRKNKSRVKHTTLGPKSSVQDSACWEPYSLSPVDPRAAHAALIMRSSHHHGNSTRVLAVYSPSLRPVLSVAPPRGWPGCSQPRATQCGRVPFHRPFPRHARCASPSNLRGTNEIRLLRRTIFWASDAPYNSCFTSMHQSVLCFPSQSNCTRP